MADFIDYLLTAVWFDDYTTCENVTSALVHKLTGTSVSRAEKKTKSELIKLVTDFKVCTAVWNYTAAQWTLGSLITLEEVNGAIYLRSRPGNGQQDNLKNLLRGGNITLSNL